LKTKNGRRGFIGTERHILPAAARTEGARPVDQSPAGLAQGERK
jgi:hypothetical protein